MRKRTLVTRAGLPEPARGEPFLPGPVFAATFHTPGEPADSPYSYGRYHNPTWSLYEQALAELEGGPSLAFASGMAAVMAVFGVTLRPGDVLVLPSDCYHAVRSLANGYLQEMGIVVRMAPTQGNAQAQHLAGARLLWLETPSNPSLDVCDIAALVGQAHAQGTLVAVDNTTPTPLAQQPLALGADFSASADTKALVGHSDLLLGHVAVRDSAWMDRLRLWRTQTGAIPGPMETWLAHRSIATLAVRFERQSANALAVARYLQDHPAVLAVRYPGLPGDPSHAIASRQMSLFGSVVSFTLSSREAAENFLSSCHLVYVATSYGGIHTSAERRARWGGDDVPEGFIRMSIGIEDIDDLLEDLSQALESRDADCV
ncbi:MAG: cystathionine gamma-lyase [Chloroflexi bacterium RBG_16_58_14]|nr:MAG: cystathionine gamma-lyase [Chloroflexi bacterium RBG_16_58_14]